MNRGFTLIELIASIAVFLCIITAFNYLMKTGKSAMAAAEQQKQAVYLAIVKMEELRGESFAVISAQNGAAFADGKGKISISPIAIDLLQVQVDIKWAEEKNLIQLITLRSAY
ncbi:MAG: type II secretion system protein [Candidatus Margulisbacteria bacterium]|nr:type II secretion system protein [Candidatus Margulisiibacteriota bacterium]